ncbi:arginase family protein [Anaerosalibacter sp. Marseille-P3206]|uniref:arginase family protein n=1 Tax=Anaerosalibacter sp. Marseille-P3206 TaxID=1871005 RepID=UPI001F284B64|nr:arginase family protein [Anaerosalibacter sp. Marseille-P3206]
MTGVDSPATLFFFCFVISKELLAAIHMISGLNIVAFDINELSPVYDQSGASTALACKLLRELLLQIYK